MKIEKLYTLSQYVDIIFKISEGANPIVFEDNMLSIYKYNEFLKQPLKKEMFINELKEPSRYSQFKHGKFLLLNKQNLRRCHEFEEAEKKVIFVSKSLSRSGDSKSFWMLWNLGEKDSRTIQELARLTDGKLELKNVEL